MLQQAMRPPTGSPGPTPQGPGPSPVTPPNPQAQAANAQFGAPEFPSPQPADPYANARAGGDIPVTLLPGEKKKLKRLPRFDGDIKFASEDDRKALGVDLTRKIRAAMSDLSTRHDYIRKWRSQYEAAVVPKTFPWDGCSSLNVPTTRAIVDTMAAHALAAMTGTYPLFRTTYTRERDSDLAAKIEKLINFQASEEIDCPAFWRNNLAAMLVDGNVFGFCNWKRTLSRVRDVEFETDGDQDSPGILYDGDGAPLFKLVETDEITEDRPEWAAISALDMVIYPAGSASVAEAQVKGFRDLVTKNDLMKGVKSQMYDAAQVDALLETAPKITRKSEQYGGDDNVDGNVGITSDSWDGDGSGYYEVFWVMAEYDRDGDGIAEDCWFCVQPDSGLLLKAEDFPFWHMKCPFVSYCPFPRQGRIFGYSLAEILEGPHNEINAIRNQRMDAGTLANFGEYTAPLSARKDFTAAKRGPGRIHYLDEPDKIKPLIAVPPTQSMFAEEAAARDMAERVSGISDAAQGTQPSRSRTLGELNSVLTEGNLKINVVIANLQAANDEMMQQTVQLNYQFLPAEVEFPIVEDFGPDPSTGQMRRMFATIGREDLRTRVRVQAQGNTLTSNKELMLQAAETAFTMGMNNPLISSDLTRVWEVTNLYVRAMGLGFDPTLFIGTKQQAAAAQQARETAGMQPKAEPPSIRANVDEIAGLAVLYKQGDIAPADYDAAAAQMHKQVELLGGTAALAQAAALAKQNPTLPPVPGALTPHAGEQVNPLAQMIGASGPQGGQPGQ